MSVKYWSKKSSKSIFWGAVLIIAAILLILQGAGVSFGYGLSIWRIVLGVILLAWIIEKLLKCAFSEVIFPLAFEFLLFEGPIANAFGLENKDIIDNWIVLLAAFFATVGLGILLPKRKTDGLCFEKNIGNTTVNIDASSFSNADIHDVLGNVNAYFINTGSYNGSGVVHIYDNTGKITLHVPKSWNAVVDSYDNLGNVEVPAREDGVFDHTVTLDIHDNLGKIMVIYE